MDINIQRTHMIFKEHQWIPKQWQIPEVGAMLEDARETERVLQGQLPEGIPEGQT